MMRDMLSRPQRWFQFVAPALLCAVTITCSSGHAICQVLPQSEARTLSEKKVTFPEALRGRITVIVIGFTHASRNTAAAWGKRIAQEFGHSDVQYYQAAMLQDVPRLIRGMVTSGIRKGVPPSEHDRFLLLFDKEDEWKKIAQFSEPDAAYVLLLDREAKVVWSTHGNVDDNAVAELESHIAAVKQQTAR
jgi:ATP10 protein